MKKKILIKTPQCEIQFEDLCLKEYRKINNLLTEIEKTFNTSMDNHPELRHEILDISNFIRRIPNMISDVVGDDDDN